MTIQRTPRPQSNFTILSNEILRDNRLSFRARGILASVLSRPDNWRTSADSLANESIEGRGAILTALKELEVLGYLERTKYQNELGHWVSDSLIYDQPKYEKPTSAQPTSENSTLLKELYKNNDEQVEITPSGINASTIVAEYVDSFQHYFGEKAPARSIGRIAKDAKQLLGEGKNPELLKAAAQDCAVSGHANLSSSYTWALAEQTRNDKKKSPAQGWLELLNQETTNHLELEQ
tara:strand:+ start:831 stop:1535 length:705 start_codon:yes stop_codon:yes gene_type:complete